MFHSFFNVSALIIENLLLLTFDIILRKRQSDSRKSKAFCSLHFQRRKFPTNVSVHINSVV